MSEKSSVIEIRAADERDVHALARMYRMQAELHSRLEPAWSVRPDFDWDGMAASQLSAVNRKVFVAVADDEPVAFILVRFRAPAGLQSNASLARRVVRWVRDRRRVPVTAIDANAAITAPPVGIVEDCYVDEQARRSGIGRRLVDAGVDWLQDRGLRRVQLQVTSTNEAAVRFWQHCGFTIGRHRMDRDLDENGD